MCFVVSPAHRRRYVSGVVLAWSFCQPPGVVGAAQPVQGIRNSVVAASGVSALGSLGAVDDLAVWIPAATVNPAASLSVGHQAIKQAQKLPAGAEGIVTKRYVVAIAVADNGVSGATRDLFGNLAGGVPLPCIKFQRRALVCFPTTHIRTAW